MLLTLETGNPAGAQGLLQRCYPNGAQRGTTVALDLQGEGLPDTATLVVDGEGIAASRPFQKGKGTVVVAAEAVPGIRHLRLAGPAGISTPRPFAVGILPEILEKEPNQDPSQAQEIASLPVVVNGELVRRPDIDTFRIRLSRGECLVIAGESRALGAPTNLLVRIRDAAGRELLVQMDSRTRDPLLGFTAPAEGDYYVELSDILNNYSNIDSAYVYRVVFTRGPWIDRVHPAGVQAGVASRVEVFGWNLGGRPGPGSVSEEVRPPADCGERWEVSLAGCPRPYPLGTASLPHAAEQEGPDPTVVQPPVACTGVLDKPGDRDAFRFPARTGDEFHVQVEARELGSVLEPVVELRDTEEKVLARAEASRRSRDSGIVWRAPAAGLYTVTIRDIAGLARGGSDFFYRLRIAPPAEELSVTVESTSFALKPGSRLEIPVSVSATRIAGEVTLAAEGLPAGVSAEPVRVAAGGRRGTASRIVLQATAAALPGPCLFRIAASAGSHRSFAEASWELSKDRSGTLARGSTSALGLVVTAP